MKTIPIPKKTSPTIGASTRKMTPAKVMPAKFTIGAARPGSKVAVAMKRGSVMEAKMKLEDKIRKEKREKKIEEVRKPLLATPTRKRERTKRGIGSQIQSQRMTERQPQERQGHQS